MEDFVTKGFFSGFENEMALNVTCKWERVMFDGHHIHILEFQLMKRIPIIINKDNS